jgi:hypothetical protein
MAAAAANNQPAPWAGDANQWRIVWHTPGDPPDALIVRRFSDAWGRAQPPAADDEPGWTYTRRANLWAQLAEGQLVRIAWRDDDGTFITLQRL